MWARADVRHRWRSLVALGLLAGVTAGLAFAASAGARRTSTALDRLRARTNASDAVVFTSQVGEILPDWTRLRARPEIETLARWALVFGEIGGDPGGVLFAPVDGTWTGDVDRPLVVKGRMFDPKATRSSSTRTSSAPGSPTSATSCRSTRTAPPSRRTVDRRRAPGPRCVSSES